MTQQFPFPTRNLEGSECPCPECADMRATRASACADCLSRACHYLAGPGCIKGCPCHAEGDSGDMRGCTLCRNTGIVAHIGYGTSPCPLCKQEADR